MSGYHGRTIAFTFKNFRAEILMGEDSTRISFVNRESTFESVHELCSHIRHHGYYGGIRLLKATIKRFHDHCKEHSIAADFEKKFKVTYTSNIPQQVGLAGSSAIITATFRALVDFYGVSIDQAVLPNLIREVETQELSIPAGLQDRVVQVYDTLIFMDFNTSYMDTHGHGLYEPIQLPGTMPPFYIAYRADSSEGTEVSHNRLRYKYDEGDKHAHDAMRFWADLTLEAREALEKNDQERLFRCINQNFDMRRKLYETLHIRSNRAPMVCSHVNRGPAPNLPDREVFVGTCPNEKDFLLLKKPRSKRHSCRPAGLRRKPNGDHPGDRTAGFSARFLPAPRRFPRN